MKVGPYISGIAIKMSGFLSQGMTSGTNSWEGPSTCLPGAEDAAYLDLIYGNRNSDRSYH
jgi:hypothetical protein